MKITIDEKEYEGEFIVIELDNTNRVVVEEVESGELSITNIGPVGLPKAQLPVGLRLYPVDYSTISIIPEG